MTSWRSLFAFFPVFALATAACSSPAATPVVETPRTAPTVALTDLADLTAVREAITVGTTASDTVALSKLELFAVDATEPFATTTDAPFEAIAWDTKTAPDGVVSVFARATNTAGLTAETKPVRVIVYNAGQAAKITDGVKGYVSVPVDYDPATATVELDVKAHWTNPAGIGRIIAVLDWQVEAGKKTWNLEYSVGTGECPDVGVTIGKKVTSTVSPIVVDVTPTAATTKTGLHFAHIKPVDFVDHKGDKVPYSVRVYLLTK